MIRKEPETLADFPAYRIVETLPNWQDKLTVRHGQIVAVKMRGRWKLFHAGSCAAYALEYDECPIEAFNSAVARGHKTHWLNACAVTISNMRTEKKTHKALAIGDVVLFEGREFEIVPAPNDNLNLRPV